MYHTARDIYNFLDKKLLDQLSTVLRNELFARGVRATSDDDQIRVNALKEASSTTYKKLESELLQVQMAELRSHLCLAFLTLFCNDFLDAGMEAAYLEKIDPQLVSRERSRLEDETRQMIAEENLLSPRSIDYKILERLNACLRVLFAKDTRVVKRFIYNFVQTLYSETRWHLKNYESLRSKSPKIIGFYEFEFLLNMCAFAEQFTAEDSYQKIRSVFGDLAAEVLDRQKLFSFYKLKLKTMHIRYHYIFAFRAVAASAE